MSSNRRTRPPRPPYRPEDEDIIETQAPRRDPRRRSPYVPRQRVPREEPLVEEYYEEEPQPRSRRAPARQQPQQPAWRQARQQQPYDDHDEYVDEGAFDDRVVPPAQARPRPAATRRVARRAQPAETYAEPLYEEYDDYDDRFDDGFIDEDDWYEEEAAAGGYRPRQRSARSVPRPSISVPRPTMPQITLPRPTVPTAVREAALAQDRGSLFLIGVLLLSVIAMALVTMTRVDTLAPGFPTHISASGVREAFRSETALWQLPLMAGAMLLMNMVLAWFLAAWSTFSARFALIASILVQVVIWVALVRLAY